MNTFLHGIVGLFRGKARSAALIAQEEAFRSLAEHSSDVICRITAGGLFRYVSPSASVMFGVGPEEMVGKSAMQYILPADHGVVGAAMMRMGMRDSDEVRTEARAVRPDGRQVWVEASAKLVPAVHSLLPEAVLVLRDITERKHLEERLASQALEDGLTGLANRRALDQALDQEWSRTLRASSRMGLLLLDIDHFKKFNDHYGHQAGDGCLRAVAEVVKAAARRGGDVAARYGGEEFALLLSNPERDAAASIAEDIRADVAALAVPHGGIGPDAVVTVSIGVASVVARPGSTIKMPETLIQVADSALYRAKNRGRNRVETEMVPEALLRSSYG